ncbi:MAG: hypothetical protein V3W41_21905 [Planctomycetota bacterium]
MSWNSKLETMATWQAKLDNPQHPSVTEAEREKDEMVGDLMSILKALVTDARDREGDFGRLAREIAVNSVRVGRALGQLTTEEANRSLAAIADEGDRDPMLEVAAREAVARWNDDNNDAREAGSDAFFYAMNLLEKVLKEMPRRLDGTEEGTST